jgi:hypothetical protein
MSTLGGGGGGGQLFPIKGQSLRQSRFNVLSSQSIIVDFQPPAVFSK